MTISDISVYKGDGWTWVCRWLYNDQRPTWLAPMNHRTFRTNANCRGLYLIHPDKPVEELIPPSEVDFSGFLLEVSYPTGNKPLYSKIRRAMLSISKPTGPPKTGGGKKKIKLDPNKLLDNG